MSWNVDQLFIKNSFTHIRFVITHVIVLHASLPTTPTKPKKKVEAKVANKNRKSVKPDEPLDLVAEMLRQQR